MQYTVGVECIIEYNGKLLFIRRPSHKHAGGTLAFPGGGVEGEKELNHQDILRCAAKREVFEEVGLTLKDPLIYLTTSYFVDDFEKPVIHSVFYCRLYNTLPTLNINAAEVPEYTWITPANALLNAETPSWIKKYIQLLPKEKSED